MFWQMILAGFIGSLLNLFLMVVAITFGVNYANRKKVNMINDFMTGKGAIK